MVGGRMMGEGELAEMIGYESQRSKGKLEVRIRTDRLVPYRVIEPIMVACARSGVWKVTFAVKGG
jgi:biopolymer transport protein ExbD